MTMIDKLELRKTMAPVVRECW